MDLGVGAFIFSAALVSRQTRRLRSPDSLFQGPPRPTGELAASASPAEPPSAQSAGARSEDHLPVSGAGAVAAARAASNTVTSPVKGTRRQGSKSPSPTARDRAAAGNGHGRRGAAAGAAREQRGDGALSPTAASPAQPALARASVPAPLQLPGAQGGGPADAASALLLEEWDDPPTVLRPLTHAVRTSLLSPASVRGLTTAGLGQSLLRALWSTILAVSPLLVMGLARLLVHEAVNYQRHESEYGTHWNFFFTSVAVALFAAALEAAWRTAVHCYERRAFRRLHVSRSGTALGYLLLGLAVAAGYQLLLRLPALMVLGERHLPPEFLASPAAAGSAAAADAAASAGFGASDHAPRHAFSVEDFIMHDAPRHTSSLLAQNREGLAGVFGFFAIYLCGVGIGRVLLDPTRRAPAQWRALFLRGCVACVALWGLLEASTRVSGPVSRRLVNLPYVIWVVAFAATMLLANGAIDVCTVAYTGRPQAEAKALPADAAASRQQLAAPTVPPQPASPATAAVREKQVESSVGGAAPASPEEIASRRRGSSAHSGGWTLSPGSPPFSVSGGGHTGLVAVLRAEVAQKGLPRALLSTARRMFIDPAPLPASVLQSGSVIMHALNGNFLAIFIVSNLLVGLPNHTIYTIDVPDGPAMAILTAYIFAVCAVAVGWRSLGLQLKFW